MICIMNVEHAIRIHLLSRIQFLEYTHLYISDFDYEIICITGVELFLFKSDKIVLFHIKLNENKVFFFQ